LTETAELSSGGFGNMQEDKDKDKDNHSDLNSNQLDINNKQTDDYGTWDNQGRYM